MFLIFLKKTYPAISMVIDLIKTGYVNTREPYQIIQEFLFATILTFPVPIFIYVYDFIDNLFSITDYK